MEMLYAYLERVATSAITRSRVDDTEPLTVDAVASSHGHQGSMSGNRRRDGQEEESGGELGEHGEWIGGKMGRYQSVESGM